MEQRYRSAVEAVGALLSAGLAVFSPIAHNHHVNLACQLAKEDGASRWEFWKRFDLLMIDRADAVIVLRLNGWRQSRGVNAEIEHAQRTGKPVYYFDPYGPGSFNDTAHMLADALEPREVLA
jgi:anaerobic selenocysteine-containing dehydrogenase